MLEDLKRTIKFLEFYFCESQKKEMYSFTNARDSVDAESTLAPEFLPGLM